MCGLRREGEKERERGRVKRTGKRRDGKRGRKQEKRKMVCAQVHGFKHFHVGKKSSRKRNAQLYHFTVTLLQDPFIISNR